MSFNTFSRSGLDAFINHREGETKLGEVVQVPGNNELTKAIERTDVRFVLLGIPEDIGVQANGGIGGAHTVWEPALKALLNTQATSHFPGASLLVAGWFDFAAWMQEAADCSLQRKRELVAMIDDEVFPIIRQIVAAGKIPIVVGGGHNNAYPLIKGTSLARGARINAINLDAHSDYRVMEGRHSGNGFRYARHDGFLAKYAMVGLHRSYNSEEVLNDLFADKGLQCSFYEDIFLNETFSFREAIDAAIKHTKDTTTGIELDLDCIQGVLSSASTPSGITVLQARQYVHIVAQWVNCAYLHLTEGAVQLRDGRTSPDAAKLIAYLVRDFIQAS